jgi:hypothetical protein
MAIEAGDVPRLTEVASRIHLTTVELTEDGDIFYVVKDPETVWLHGDTGMEQCFACPGNDTWFTRHIFGGDPKQTVVVIHNTQKYLREDG